MEIKLRTLKPNEASSMSNVLKDFSCEALLKRGGFCIDGKSMLGILAIMYDCKGEDIILEINELDPGLYPEFMGKMSSFLKAE